MQRNPKRTVIYFHAIKLRVEVRGGGGGNTTFLWKLSSVHMHGSMQTVKLWKACFPHCFVGIKGTVQYSCRLLNPVFLSCYCFLLWFIEDHSWYLLRANKKGLLGFQAFYAKQDTGIFSDLVVLGDKDFAEVDKNILGFLMAIWNYWLDRPLSSMSTLQGVATSSCLGRRNSKNVHSRLS